MDMMTNRNTTLTPRTSFDGPTLTFDFPGLEIGVAEYDEGPTGCTVFSFPGGAATAIDERGGWVGRTIGYDWNHAICLAGGSLYGLEAAAGVSAALFERDGYSWRGPFRRMRRGLRFCAWSFVDGAHHLSVSYHAGRRYALRGNHQ